MNSQYISTTGSFILSQEITAISSATTTSSTDALLSGMTVTPAAGKYLVMFNTDFNSNSAGAAITFSYYVGGTQVAVTQRKIIPFDGGALSAAAARGMGTLQSVITVNGSQAIEVQWSTSGGTATSDNRSLITVKSS